MNQIKLNKFNPMILEKKRREGHAPVCVFVGKRGSGKSILVEDILYHFTDIPAVLCMSGTEDGNGFYSKHIHDIYIYNKFDQEVLSEVIKRQKGIVKEYADNGIDPKKHPEIGIGILMDDLAYDAKMMKDQSIKEIFFNGRHYHITTLITFQYMMALNPAFRTNVDYVFVCRDNKLDNLKRLYEYFFGIFDKLEDFKKVFYACTNDFGCLVLDNTSRSNKIEDQVFWYKAKPNRKYKIGTPEMWNIWNNQLKDRGDNEEHEERVSLSKSSIKNIKKLGPKHVEFDNNHNNDDDDVDDSINH